MAESDIMLVENKTLYEALFKQRNIFFDTFMILFSVVFLAVMANIRIPLWPVPITMQTFGVFVVAFFFGSRKGFLAIIAYILAGLFGFGVFSGYKSGFGALIGPTGGYIAGFVFMAVIVGWMIEKGYGRTKKSVALCMLVGEAVLYTVGLAGLWLYLGGVSLAELLMLGFIPFVIGDILKVLGAVALFPYLWKGAEKITQ
ncbi:biotin transporter BioY [Candidatus Woesearchaeota archaeon]|nr:biotin transporter BioY [Candidatus Woesearchaeota archaeon]